MKRRLAAAFVVLVAGAAAAVAYTAAVRDREYRRLVAAGEAALASGQTSVAIEAFSGAIALKPDSMLAHLKRGETYRRHGDLKAAFRDLRDASELDPSATRPLEQLGDVSLALNRPDRAAERYAAYVAARRPVAARALQARRWRTTAPASPPSRWRSVRRALALDDQLRGGALPGGPVPGRAGPARRRAQGPRARHRRCSRRFIPAREALAAAYRSSGRHVDATEQLEALAALDRGRPARLIALGLEYADARRTDLAVATLGRAAERFPDNVDVYATLGEVWLRTALDTGDRVALGKALEALRTAVVRGGSSRELALYGRALLAAGDTAAALAIAARSLDEAAGGAGARCSIWPPPPSGRATAGRRAMRSNGTWRCWPVDAARSAVVRRLGDLSLALGDAPDAVRWWRRAADGHHRRHAARAAGAGRIARGRPDAARQTVAAPSRSRPRIRRACAGHRRGWRLGH